MTRSLGWPPLSVKSIARSLFAAASVLAGVTLKLSTLIAEAIDAHVRQAAEAAARVVRNGRRRGVRLFTAPMMPQLMPIYEYRCENDHRFEAFQAMADDALDTCEVCGAPAQRVLSAPAVHFKGSGFYTTDYARKGKAKPASRRRLGREVRRGEEVGRLEAAQTPRASRRQVASELSPQGEHSAGCTAAPGRLPEELLDRLLALALLDDQRAVARRARRLEDLRRRVAADRGGHRQLRKGEAAHVADHRLRRVPGDPGGVDDVVGNPGRAGQPVLDPGEDQLLALRALGVALAGVLEVLARPGEGERLLPVEVVLAAFELQRDAAVGGAAGDLALDRLAQGRPGRPRGRR